MNYEQYYPTPAELGNKLAKLINKPQPPILEPSAGTGDLIQAFTEARKFNRWEHRYSEKEFHCVELNADRAATLKGNGFAVIWDDFLTLFQSTHLHGATRQHARYFNPRTIRCIYFNPRAIRCE